MLPAAGEEVALQSHIHLSPEGKAVLAEILTGLMGKTADSSLLFLPEEEAEEAPRYPTEAQVVRLDRASISIQVLREPLCREEKEGMEHRAVLTAPVPAEAEAILEEEEAVLVLGVKQLARILPPEEEVAEVQAFVRQGRVQARPIRKAFKMGTDIFNLQRLYHQT